MYAKTVSTSRKFAALNEAGGKLADFCQALYPLLIAHADDSGRQQGDVFTVKHAVHPTSPKSPGDFEKALGCLSKVGLIYWYEVGGHKFLEIHDFARYQPGLKNRDNSKIPPMPPDAVTFAACREMPSEEKRREEKGIEGKGREENSAAAGSPLASVTVENDTKQPNCKLEAFVTLWNQTITAPLPQCRGLSDKRKAHIRARLSERPFGEWLALFQRVNDTPFLRGENDRGWVASLDWLVSSPDNALKVLEGKYDHRPQADKRRPAWAK